MNVYDLAERYERLRGKTSRHCYVQLTDDKEAVIYGASGVLRYDENLIKLRLGTSYISIVGYSLKMSSFGGDGIIVRGRLFSVTYTEE